MTDMDVPLSIQTERSHTEYPPPVLLSLMVYEDFPRLLFLHTYREASILAGELPEESEQFRFPIDLSMWSFIPLPRFLDSRRVPPLLNQSLVLIPQQSV